ncbi:hypothetical protein QF022_002156 [Vogesella perlucida]|nr:hypothetical protein [Vogesella perlucida]
MDESVLVLRILFIACAFRVAGFLPSRARGALSPFVMHCTIGDVPDGVQAKIVAGLSDKMMKNKGFCHENFH